jgi:Carboxypeptidase regulatory-like domain
MKSFRFWFVFILCISFTTFSLLPARGQSTISTGSIQGTVTDPNGAVVPGANITITNKATGQVNKTTSSATGTYASGALGPGEYEVRIEAKGFQTQVLTIPVQVGNTAAGNAKLAVGQGSEVVEVTGSAVAVNTEQSTVQGVLTTQQIENLPINGRNFLDLAQLEPGVQIQDGGNFDPTKNGFSSISFGGRFGRTARIEVDGIDISDETVGTTTQNLPASAIQEFQVSQSSLDLSTELTSSGAVNVITKSGTNKWHGQAFYLFRDHSIAARIAPTDLSFQRNNFGGQIGGPILKDKLFLFFDAERLKQDLQDPVLLQGPFAGLTGGFNSPFRDTEGVAKLDWHITENVKAFYRFSYEQNRSVRGFIQNSFQPFANVNNTPVHVAGLDFNTGSFSHSIRFGYTKFRNGITDGTAGVFNPAPEISLTLGADPFCLTGGVDSFCSGPNLLAPQQTFQQNTQAKYDGSKTIHSHILRYGFGYNHIQGGGFAKFFGLAPTVNADPTVDFDPLNAPFPGGATNPLNYLVDLVVMGNGQGFSSEKPAFGLPGGGLGPDNRIQFYVGDSWKMRPNLTVNYGVRYVRDTGRTDSDIPPIPCSSIDQTGNFLDPTIAAAALAQCGGGNLLDLWGAGLGNRVRVPGHNFGPTAGFAWDPTGSGKTVIRAGAGLYYENSIFNNNLFNRPGRLAQGLFLNEAVPCAGGAPTGFTLPGGAPFPAGTDPALLCGQPIGSVAAQLGQLQAAYQAAVLAQGPAANGAFIGNTLAAGGGVNGINLFAPNYQTPRSVQMNIGFQQQLGKGVVWTTDYIRNVGTHTLLAIDVNHVGDVRFFNKANAQAAIAATNAAFGCADVNCAIAAGATIADYASNGLDSGTNLCGGFSCPNAAFPGQNPILGVNQMLFPAGRSTYNALETSLRANVRNPFWGVKGLNWQFSYALSRYLGSALDSDFINTAPDNNQPNAFLGPNGLDRTSQVSFGGTFELPGNLRFSTIGHIYSPLPVSLLLPAGNAIDGGLGGIFSSDATGDGSGDGSGVYSTGDLLPGTKIGAFGRKIKAKDLTAFINNYNATIAGTPTPAGQVLIQNGLFTAAQLQAIGAVFPALQPPVNSDLGLGWLKTVDLKLGYLLKFRESLSLEPSVSFFNAFNFRNTDLPGNTLNGILNAGPGSLNGTTGLIDSLTNRVTPGSGVFDLGAPRVIEFGLKFNF